MSSQASPVSLHQVLAPAILLAHPKLAMGDVDAVTAAAKATFSEVLPYSDGSETGIRSLHFGERTFRIGFYPEIRERSDLSHFLHFNAKLAIAGQLPQKEAAAEICGLYTPQASRLLERVGISLDHLYEHPMPDDFATLLTGNLDDLGWYGDAAPEHHLSQALELFGLMPIHGPHGRGEEFHVRCAELADKVSADLEEMSGVPVSADHKSVLYTVIERIADNAPELSIKIAP